jgi:hypothetical protein
VVTILLNVIIATGFIISEPTFIQHNNCIKHNKQRSQVGSTIITCPSHLRCFQTLFHPCPMIHRPVDVEVI